MDKSVITIIGKINAQDSACGDHHKHGEACGCDGAKHEAQDNCGCDGSKQETQDNCGCDGSKHEAQDNCGCGCDGAEHEQADNSDCASSCGGGCGGHHHHHHHQALSDMQQFVNLKDYILKVDMQDEIRLQFMDWTDEMPAKYPKIAELISQGYELPMVAIDDSIRLAGAVKPEKVIHIVNEMREKRRLEELQ